MSDLLPLITVPDERLRVVSEEITQVDGAIRELFYSMVSTMYNSEGIGLAGIQVGIAKRIIVIDIDNLEEHPSFEYPICLINPEISLINNKTSSMQEGCLSIPGEYVKIVRPSSVAVRYLDLEGQICNIKAEGLLAKVIQHEYDHLQGKLLIDYLSYFEQDKILEKASMRRGVGPVL
jgi:peptide deformylase